jgi:hypothetical protein
MRLIALLQIILLSLTFTMLTTGSCLAQAQSSPQNERLTEAQIRNQEAQTAYYRKQLEERPLWQKIGDNPAAIGAVIAAFVALISFIFNYRATLRNQIDTQFYEAMKRFGDKDSPTLRASAAGILAQMGRRRTFTVHWESPFFWRFPYLRTAFDQLLSGLLVEEDRMALKAVTSALHELISAHKTLARRRLFATNGALAMDLVRALAEFFVSKSEAKVQLQSERQWATTDIHNDLWQEAAFVTRYKKTVLQELAAGIKSHFLIFLTRHSWRKTLPARARPMSMP